VDELALKPRVLNIQIHSFLYCFCNLPSDWWKVKPLDDNARPQVCGNCQWIRN